MRLHYYLAILSVLFPAAVSQAADFPDEERNIIAIHAYQFGMLPEDCLNLRDSIVSESSNKYGIEFGLITRSTGTEYLASESESMAIVVDCRNVGARLRLALAIKRQN